LFQCIKINQINSDEHIFIWIKCQDRPDISIDIQNIAGRRTMGTRINGMGIVGQLLDLIELEPISKEIHRFCPICGEEINLVSSKLHECKE